MKNVWFDMDDTLVDFSKQDLTSALLAMHNPDYYKGLQPNKPMVDFLIHLHKIGVKVRTVSGIADLKQSGDYLTTVLNYNNYFNNVMSNKVEWLDVNISLVKDKVFTRQSDRKCVAVVQFYGRDLTEDDILVDDNPQYCVDWVRYGGTAVLVTRDDSRYRFRLNRYNSSATETKFIGYVTPMNYSVLTELLLCSGKEFEKEIKNNMEKVKSVKLESEGTENPCTKKSTDGKEWVNHPAHYGGKDNPYECIKVIEAWGLQNDFNIGTALRYLSRQGKKVIGDNTAQLAAIEDIKKAEWYLHRRVLELNGFQEYKFDEFKAEINSLKQETIDKIKKNKVDSHIPLEVTYYSKLLELVESFCDSVLKLCEK